MNVFHATNIEFDDFKNKFMDSNNTCQQLGHGFYFSDDIEGARQYGDVILECQIPNLDHGYFERFEEEASPRGLIEKLIRYAPDLNNTLTNWGDVKFQSKEQPIQQAIEGYVGMNHYQLCNVLSNDFYRDNPLEFNQRISEYTGYVGLNDCHNYCVFDAKNIKIVVRLE